MEFLIFLLIAHIQKTKDWDKIIFEKVKFISLKENIEKQLITSSFLIKEVAEKNRKKKKKCSIILLNSIYGLVGQDKSIYKGTNVYENISYSITKRSFDFKFDKADVLTLFKIWNKS